MPEEKRTPRVNNGASGQGNAEKRRNVAAEGGDVAVSDSAGTAPGGAAADETDIVASAAAAWRGGANGHGPRAENADAAAPAPAGDAAPAAGELAAEDGPVAGGPADEAVAEPVLEACPAADDRKADGTDAVTDADLTVRRTDRPHRAVPEPPGSPADSEEFADAGERVDSEGFPDAGERVDSEGFPDAGERMHSEGFPDAGERVDSEGFPDAGERVDSEGFPDAGERMHSEGFPDAGERVDSEGFPDAGERMHSEGFPGAGGRVDRTAPNGAAAHPPARMPGGAAHRVAPGRAKGPARAQRPPLHKPDAPAQAPRRSAPAPARSGRKKRRNRRDVGETNLLIIKICLAAGLLLALTLVIVSIVMVQRGKKAEQYANQLLQAYQEKQSTATPAAATDTPAATASASPAPIDTEEPAASTDPQADAEAMALANEHAFDDDSHEGVDETADYVQPDAPDETEAEKIIASVVNKVGEDGIIGVLKIPVIGIELPVIGKWSYSLLKISVCRYKGPSANSKGNLVIIGHNYKSGAHFGNLNELKVGSAVYLTDTNSSRVRYEVYDMETIEPDSFSKLNEFKGKAGLTLMTCKNSGNSRLVVRCVQKDVELPGPR